MFKTCFETALPKQIVSEAIFNDDLSSLFVAACDYPAKGRLMIYGFDVILQTELGRLKLNDLGESANAIWWINSGDIVGIRDFYGYNYIVDINTFSFEKESTRKDLTLGFPRFSLHDGRIVWTHERTIFVAKWGASRPSLVLHEKRGEITRVATDHEERYLVASSSGSVVDIWDIRSGQRVQQFKLHRARVNSAAMSPDGEHIVSTCPRYKEIIFWRRKDALPRQYIKIDDPIHYAYFHPNGRHLILASRYPDWKFLLWDLRKQTIVSKWTIADFELQGFTCSGDLIAVTDWRGNLEIVKVIPDP